MSPVIPRSPDASVVVCTRNRSRLLLEACRSILEVDYPAERWELLIVDNASTDDTLEIAHHFAAEHSGRVRVLVEEELGLSAARNGGIREARGEIVAFIDDDAFPEPGWLEALVEVLRLPGAVAAGGPVDPLYQGEPPDWLDDRYLPYLTVWDPGPERRELRYNEYPRGANIAFRRDALERYGGFSHHLGRKGSSLLSCEEIELCLRMQRRGGKIFYAPGARVGHQVHAERITEGWLLDRFGAQGRSEAIIDWRHGGLAGLRAGWQRFRENSRAAQAENGSNSGFHRQLQDRSLRAYTLSALTCPLRIRRYQPEVALEPWLPVVG